MSAIACGSYREIALKWVSEIVAKSPAFYLVREIALKSAFSGDSLFLLCLALCTHDE